MASTSGSTRGVNPREEVRTRTGCLTCRQRRVKCDEVRPICKHCARGSDICRWPGNSTSITESSTGRQKRRTTVACNTCRKRKLKCSGPISGSACDRCRASSQQIDCDFTKERRSSSPTMTVSFRSSETLMQNDANLAELLQTYFLTVHQYGFLTFIHPPQFRRLQERRCLPPELTLIMAASAMRFAMCKSSADMDVADQWADEALARVNPCLSSGFGALHLMVVLLAQRYEYARGSMTSWWMLTGSASRMMTYLGLHCVDDTFLPNGQFKLSPLLRMETLRRLAWSVFFMDTISDGGRHDVATVAESTIRNQLPCDEPDFIRDVTVITTPLYPSVPFSEDASSAILGVSAHLMKTAAIRRRILHFASRISQTTRSSSELQTDLLMLTLDLTEVISSLPPQLAYSREQMYVLTDRLPAFILLHTLRHNCYVILERAKILVYSRLTETLPLIMQCRRDRISRAIPTAGIIAEALRMNVNIDPHIAVQAYVALEILLLEPRRLAQGHQSLGEVSDSQITNALESLLSVMRLLAPVSRVIARLYEEATYRLILCGQDQLLTQVDWATLKNATTGNIAGQDEAEFDFRNFRRDMQEEYSRRAGLSAASLATESLLNVGLNSVLASRANTPPLDARHFQTNRQTLLSPLATAPVPISSEPLSNGLPAPLNPANPWHNPSDLHWDNANGDVDPFLTELFGTVEQASFTGPGEIGVNGRVTDQWDWLSSVS